MKHNESQQTNLLEEYRRMIKEKRINIGDTVLNKTKGKRIVDINLSDFYIHIRLENKEPLLCSRWMIA